MSCSKLVQGSLVTQNRLRFDFNLHRGLKDDEVAKVEELVNGWVAADTELLTKEMPLAEAKAAGERPICPSHTIHKSWLALWRLSKFCIHTRCLPQAAALREHTPVGETTLNPAQASITRLADGSEVSLHRHAQHRRMGSLQAPSPCLGRSTAMQQCGSWRCRGPLWSFAGGPMSSALHRSLHLPSKCTGWLNACLLRPSHPTGSWIFAA